eukprot:TCONS_00023781-protein
MWCSTIFIKLLFIRSAIAITFEQCEAGDVLFTKSKVGIEIFGKNPTLSFEFTTRSATSCMSECKKHAHCWSVTFNTQTKHCRLTNYHRYTRFFWYNIVPGVEFYEKRTCGPGFNTIPKFIAIVEDATDCKDVQKKGWNMDGFYGVLIPGKSSTFKSIRCSMSLVGGGWTVILRNGYGKNVEFAQQWKNYEEGFGNLATSFWYGNDGIHNLTKPGTDNEVLFVLKAQDNQVYYPYYDGFNVGDENMNYKLSVGTYKHVHGPPLPARSMNDRTNGDDFTLMNEFHFSTSDVDNDIHGYEKCTDNFANAGWWYSNCGTVVLTAETRIKAHPGARWKQITKEDDSEMLLEAEMMVRKK